MVAQGKASRAGRAGRAGSEMWGVLLVPSSSPTLSPVYDGLDVNVTSNVTWFHLNHDMVSRRIYKLSFYGGHSITFCCHSSYARMFVTVTLLRLIGVALLVMR